MEYFYNIDESQEILRRLVLRTPHRGGYPHEHVTYAMERVAWPDEYFTVVLGMPVQRVVAMTREERFACAKRHGFFDATKLISTWERYPRRMNAPNGLLAIEWMAFGGIAHNPGRLQCLLGDALGELQMLRHIAQQNRVLFAKIAAEVSELQAKEREQAGSTHTYDIILRCRERELPPWSNPHDRLTLSAAGLEKRICYLIANLKIRRFWSDPNRHIIAIE